MVGQFEADARASHGADALDGVPPAGIFWYSSSWPVERLE